MTAGYEEPRPWTPTHQRLNLMRLIQCQQKTDTSEARCHLLPHTLTRKERCILNLGVSIAVHLLSRVRLFRLFETPCTAAYQAPLYSTVSWSLLRFMSIESVMLSNHLVFCHPLLLPSIFSASRSFPVSWHFASGVQSIRASASASMLLMNIQCWFPLGLTGLTSLQSKGLSRVFSSTTIQKSLA